MGCSSSINKENYQLNSHRINNTKIQSNISKDDIKEKEKNRNKNDSHNTRNKQ